MYTPMLKKNPNPWLKSNVWGAETAAPLLHGKRHHGFVVKPKICPDRCVLRGKSVKSFPRMYNGEHYENKQRPCASERSLKARGEARLKPRYPRTCADVAFLLFGSVQPEG